MNLKTLVALDLAIDIIIFIAGLVIGHYFL